jgi:hypothetical protein
MAWQWLKHKITHTYCIYLRPTVTEAVSPKFRLLPDTLTSLMLGVSPDVKHPPPSIESMVRSSAVTTMAGANTARISPKTLVPVVAAVIFMVKY